MIPEIERVENRPGDVATWRIMNAWGYGFEILFTGYGDEDEVTMRWVTGHPPEKHVDIVSMSAGEFVRHVFGAVKDSMIAELEAENARLLDEVAALESDNKRLEEFEKTASFSNKITITIASSADFPHMCCRMERKSGHHRLPACAMSSILLTGLPEIPGGLPALLGFR